MGMCEPVVKRGQRGVQRLGEGDVPGVVCGEVVTQIPHPFRERFVGEQVEPQLEEITLRERRDVVADIAGKGRTAEDVHHLYWHQVRRGEWLGGEERTGPRSIVAGVDECSDDDRRVGDDRHLRSESRRSKISRLVMAEPVRRFLSAIRASTTSLSGRNASWINSRRRYSCNDRPVAAARAASSSRVASGTSRIVTAGMHAFCSYSRRFASADSEGARSADSTACGDRISGHMN